MEGRGEEGREGETPRARAHTPAAVALPRFLAILNTYSRKKFSCYFYRWFYKRCAYERALRPPRRGAFLGL